MAMQLTLCDSLGLLNSFLEKPIVAENHEPSNDWTLRQDGRHFILLMYYVDAGQWWWRYVEQNEGEAFLMSRK
jgi:hypothetical protein